MSRFRLGNSPSLYLIKKANRIFTVFCGLLDFYWADLLEFYSADLLEFYPTPKRKRWPKAMIYLIKKANRIFTVFCGLLFNKKGKQDIYGVLRSSRFLLGRSSRILLGRSSRILPNPQAQEVTSGHDGLTSPTWPKAMMVLRHRGDLRPPSKNRNF